VGDFKPALPLAEHASPQEGGVFAPRATDRGAILPGRFQIRLLGQFQIMTPDSRAIALRSKRSKAALAYLVLMHGNATSRERLAGLLWSDRSEPQARASLRQCIHEIRDALPDGGKGLLLIERDRIGLNSERLLVDIEDIVTALKGDDLQALEQALERLGTDVILADLSVSDMFDDWLAGERMAWNERILAAVRQRIDRADADGSWSEVRRLADAYLSRDPAAEDVLAMALRADVEQVGMAEAKRRFTRFEERLRRELDAEPSARLQRVLAELEERSQELGPAQSGVAPPFLAPEPVRAPIDLPTIALTPFRTALADDTASLAELIGEEIETSLARVRDLRVISLPDAGYLPDDAGAGDAVTTFILIGTLRQANGAAVLNVKLQSIQREIIWSMKETFSLEKLESSVENIVERIVTAIAPSIERSMDQVFVRTGWSIDNDLLGYCHARSLARSARSLEEAKCAAEKLEAVLEKDRLNASARLHLSRLYNTDFLHNLAGHDHGALRERAFMLARAANEIDPGNAHTQTSLAFCYLRRGHWDEARVHLERALKLAPYHADRVVEAAMGLAFLGDVARAMKLVELAIELNPFPHREYMADCALLQMLAGQHRQAEQLFYASTDEALHYLAARLANLGLLDAAADQKELLVEKLRDRFRAIWQGEALPSDQDIVDWLHPHLPFREESRRQMLDQGLSRAGLKISP
jgi:DNA-binding SARP family transcriptional activator/Flp pilus assembly protein TadD